MPPGPFDRISPRKPIYLHCKKHDEEASTSKPSGTVHDYISTCPSVLNCCLKCVLQFL